MHEDKQMCGKMFKMCASGQDRCFEYHVTNATTNGVQFHGKGCAKWKNQCDNTSKFCEDIRGKHNLVPSSKCDVVCLCERLTDCSKGYSVVQAANSAIILLFAPFALVSSFV